MKSPGIVLKKLLLKLKSYSKKLKILKFATSIYNTHIQFDDNLHANNNNYNIENNIDVTPLFEETI